MVLIAFIHSFTERCSWQIMHKYQRKKNNKRYGLSSAQCLNAREKPKSKILFLQAIATEYRTLQNTRDVNRSKNSTRLAGLERSLLWFTLVLFLLILFYFVETKRELFVCIFFFSVGLYLVAVAGVVDEIDGTTEHMCLSRFFSHTWYSSTYAAYVLRTQRCAAAEQTLTQTPWNRGADINARNIITCGMSEMENVCTG